MERFTVLRRLDLGVSPVWPWPDALYPLWLGLFIFKVVLKRGQTSQGSLIKWSKSMQSIVPGTWWCSEDDPYNRGADRCCTEGLIAQPGTCHQTGRLKWQSLVCPQGKKKKKGIFQYGVLGEMGNGQHGMCRTWFGSCLILFFTVLSLHPSYSSYLAPNCSVLDSASRVKRCRWLK